MADQVFVTYSINASNLFYNGDWDGVDQEASGDEYRIAVDGKIRAYFENKGYQIGGVDVEEVYNRDDNLYVEVDGEEMTDEYLPEIYDIAGKVYGNMEWLVYNE